MNNFLRHIDRQIAVILGLTTATIFTLSQPAKAIIYSFEFTDGIERNDGRVFNQVIAGEIEFKDLDKDMAVEKQSADSVRLTTIPEWMQEGITGITPETNLLDFEGNLIKNSFELNDGEIEGAFYMKRIDDKNQGLSISTNRGSFLYGTSGKRVLMARNFDTDSLTLSEISTPMSMPSDISTDISSDFVTLNSGAASVPFEFSPSLGFLLMGGLFGTSKYLKNRKAKRAIDNN